MKATLKQNRPPITDWGPVREEATGHLQRLIQMDTRNPPGNEIIVGRYLAEVFTAAGIETQLFEPTPGKAAVVARIAGSEAARPVLLLAHMDVVAVDPEHWTVDPFGGVVQDGYLYGRGAIDDKGMLAANLMAMLLLHRHLVQTGETLSRDVVFVATSDEETGGDFGIDWLIANHPELMQAEFALNEGGRIKVVDGKPLYAAIQTAEKVSHVLTVKARGPVGHASVPVPDNAVVRLGRALVRIGEHREAVRLLPTTSRFFETLAEVWPDADEARAMKDLVSSDTNRSRAGAGRLGERASFDAALRNGISPTIVRGGSQANVIPGEVEAILNVRTLPGESVDAVVDRLRAAVGDPEVDIDVTHRGDDSPQSSFESPMFEALDAVLRDLAPSSAVVPYMSTGATDSASLRRQGVETFGLLPFPLEEGDDKRMHGHDERIPLDSFAFGIRLIFETIRRVAA